MYGSINTMVLNVSFIFSNTGIPMGLRYLSTFQTVVREGSFTEDWPESPRLSSRDA